MRSLLPFNIDFIKNETSVPLVDHHLNELKGKRVYYDQLKGNRGDDLILLGIEQQVKKAGLEIVSDISQADHLLIKGGGALIDSYGSLLKHIGDLLQSTPNMPATILPTSYHLTTNSLPKMCGDSRKAPLRVYAREKYSFEALQKCKFDCPFELGMDHDSAFHLIGSKYLNNLANRPKKKHILIVERTDAEAVTKNSLNNSKPAKGANKPKAAITALLPQSLKYHLKHRLVLPKIENQARTTAFASNTSDFIFKHHPDLKGLPIRCFDVSQNHLNTFDQFAQIIKDSAVVVSTRLHVGLFSAMLDIPTYLVAGSYHKLRGIYRYSMQDNSHVKLIDKSLNFLNL